MAIKITKNNQEVEEMQDKMTALISEFSKTNDPETEKEILKLYEEMTQFRSSCAICRSGRALFMRSLQQLKDGEKLEAVNSIKASMKAAQINWRRFTKKLL